MYKYLCKPVICSAGMRCRHLPSDVPEGQKNTIRHQLNLFVAAKFLRSGEMKAAVHHHVDVPRNGYIY